MALLWTVVIIVGAYQVAINTGNTKKRLDIERRRAAADVCPHCQRVGATPRSPAVGILKVLTVGVFALFLPGSRKCNSCGYKW